MLIILPIGDENPSSRTPYVTYGLIAVNTLVFLIANQLGNLPMDVSREFGFVPRDAKWYTFITSLFLHGNFLHIVGNMVFLWIAGDNVEDKLGHLPFLLFYLLSGVVADLAYMVFASLGAGIPLVGASGAIAGVLGAYMIMFPRARIRIFYWFWFFLGTFYVEARWFLGFWIAENLYNWLVVESTYVTGVAYAAHAGGFAAGVIAAFLLKGRLRRTVPVTRADRMTGFAPPKETARPKGRVIEMGEAAQSGYVHPRMKLTRDGEGFFGLEEAIAENVRAGRVEAALDRYEEYLGMRHAKPLPAWAQIEIAAEFFRRGSYEEAIQAYRRYLAHHPSGTDAPEAKFRLGIILSRHRNEFFRAREYLLQATIEHPDTEIVEFARQELDRIEPLL